MVAMSIDGPMGEEHIGPLGIDHIAEFPIVLLVYDGMPIALAGENGARFENFAGSSGFGNPHIGSSSGGGFGTGLLPAIQIEQRHIMALIGITGNGSPTSVFRISGVATGDDHLQLSAGGRLCS